MEPLREQFIETEDACVNYVRCGTGETLVFLHNGGGFWQSWEKQIRHFSATHDCIALDWPGFGKSTHNGKPDFSLGFYTRCLSGVLEQLGIKTCTFISNCIGASVAIQFKQQYPEGVNNLILYNICPGRRVFPNAVFSALIRRMSKYNMLRRAGIGLFAFLLRLPPLKNKSPRILFGNNFNATDPLLQLYKSVFSRREITRSRAALLFDADTFTLACFLHPGFNPANVTLLWGAENRVASFEKEALFHQQLLGLKTIQRIENGGHLCMYECPDAVNETIAAALHK